MAQERQYYSVNEPDRKLEEHLDHNSGYFVELGANNGIRQSNTLYFERFRGWRGVLIEPVPHNYFACKRNRAADNSFYCNACVSFNYKETFAPILYCNLVSTPLSLDSDLTDPVRHVVEGTQYLA